MEVIVLDDFWQYTLRETQRIIYKIARFVYRSDRRGFIFFFGNAKCGARTEMKRKGKKILFSLIILF